MDLRPRISSDRNDDLEVLRAYSVLLVLYEHMTAITGLTSLEKFRELASGWTGVDLFFCISGFVIYRTLSPSLSWRMPWTSAIRQIVVFWIRRFWRLAPAAWLWLALGLPAMLTYKSAEIGSVYDNLTDGLAALLNIENFHRYYCNVYQQVCGRLYPAWWSLSLEVQFYLLLPFALVVLRRSWLAAGLLLLIVVQFPIPRPANGVGIGWFVRTDAIAWGVLLSMLWEARLTSLFEPRFLCHPAAKAAFTLGFIYLLTTSQIFWREQFFVGLAGALAACLVWAASYDAGYISRLFGASAVLRWIGTRSYSLYVAHMIVFKATRQVYQFAGIFDFAPSGKALYLVTAYGTTFLMAEATYWLLERPLRRRGREYAVSYLDSTAVRERAAA